MEVLDLYDKYRKRTGKTYYRNEPIADDFYRLVVHVAIFNDENKLLIQQRADNKNLGGLWDVTCGGAVKAGEDSNQGISRELAEELGINIDFENIRPILTANFDKGFDDFYLINKNINIDDIILQKEEVQNVKWASIDEIEKIMEDGGFFPYKKSFIRLLFDLAKDDRFVEK